MKGTGFKRTPAPMTRKVYPLPVKPRRTRAQIEREIADLRALALAMMDRCDELSAELANAKQEHAQF